MLEQSRGLEVSCDYFRGNETASLVNRNDHQVESPHIDCDRVGIGKSQVGGSLRARTAVWVLCSNRIFNIWRREGITVTRFCETRLLVTIRELCRRHSQLRRIHSERRRWTSARATENREVRLFKIPTVGIKATSLAPKRSKLPWRSMLHRPGLHPQRTVKTLIILF